jgi:hypothetical protein
VVVAHSHHFDEEQYPDQHKSEKMDPDLSDEETLALSHM